MKKTAKRGRPRGIPRQGSGRHPLDLEWKRKGYLTITDAAAVAGIKEAALRRRILSGQLSQGVDYEKTGVGHAGAVYLRRASVLAIKRQMRPPEAA